MSAVAPPVSDMLVTVKSREVQRALLAEMRGDRPAAVRHFLAAAHLELVLADDYRQAGEAALASRSQLSAASCSWRAGQYAQAREVFDGVVAASPSEAQAVQEIVAELERDYPLPAP
jgi:hypothetical protein